MSLKDGGTLARECTGNMKNLEKHQQHVKTMVSPTADARMRLLVPNRNQSLKEDPHCIRSHLNSMLVLLKLSANAPYCITCIPW